MASRICQLHLRFPDTFGGTARYVQKLVDVFAALHTNVDFDEGSSEAVSGGRLDTIDAGECNGAPSADVEALFAEFAPVPIGDDDVMVFFAGQLTGGARLGCADHPTASRGVIVSCQAKEMVLPHEIGHLFLGDVHDHHDTENLMFENSDQIDDPPKLTSAQRKRIRTGAWASVATPPIFMDVEMANGVEKMTTLTAKKKLKKKAKTKKKTTKKLNKTTKKKLKTKAQKNMTMKKKAAPRRKAKRRR